MLSVIAKIPIKEEKMNDALEAFRQMIAQVAKEEGTLYYTLNVSKAEPHTLVVMERYRDQEALGVHSATPHFQALMARAPELFSGQPEIILMKELASI
jgi:quinol monooxygenase YgiN